MRTVLFAIAATFAVALSAASALADGPRASSGTAVSQTAQRQPISGRAATPHYEWQYHYAGHHPRYEGHWVLVN